MVKIRLKRTGRRHQASFRIVAVDARASRDGKVIETLGSYDPLAKSEDQEVRLKADRIEYWLSVGAQPTETVAQMLKKKGIYPAEVRARAKGEAKADEAPKDEPKPDQASAD